MQRRPLGEFEELVLLAIAGMGDQAYAVAIQQRLKQRTSRTATMGAIYTVLDRLVQKGYVESWLGKATPQRGGRPKRYYRIMGAGMAALTDMRQARERLWEDIDIRPALG